LLKISSCDNPSRIADVIFVHGLDGDARTAWHPRDKPEDFWPTWLGQDFPNVGLWSLGYAVSASAWKGHSMPLFDRANNTLDRLQLDGFDRRPIGFVCPSLGGLSKEAVNPRACGSDYKIAASLHCLKRR
jgi:protein SERAC1